jgi:hypothetical protein
MPDGPTIGAAEGGRHGLPGGAARAHELPVASARLTYGVPGPPVRQSPRLCATAHRGQVARLRHADPVSAALDLVRQGEGWSLSERRHNGWRTAAALSLTPACDCAECRRRAIAMRETQRRNAPGFGAQQPRGCPARFRFERPLPGHWTGHSACPPRPPGSPGGTGVCGPHASRPRPHFVRSGSADMRVKGSGCSRVRTRW